MSNLWAWQLKCGRTSVRKRHRQLHCAVHCVIPLPLPPNLHNLLPCPSKAMVDGSSGLSSASHLIHWWVRVRVSIGRFDFLSLQRQSWRWWSFSCFVLCLGRTLAMGVSACSSVTGRSSGLSLFVLFQKNTFKIVRTMHFWFCSSFHFAFKMHLAMIIDSRHSLDKLVAVKSHRPGSLGIMTFKTLCVDWQFCDLFPDVTVGSDRWHVDAWYFMNVANRVSATFLQLLLIKF